MTLEGRHHTATRLVPGVWSVRDDTERELVFGDARDAERVMRRWDARVEAGEQSNLFTT